MSAPPESPTTVRPDVTDGTTSRRRWPRRLLVVGAVATLLGIIMTSGLFDLVRDRERLVQTVADAGVWGPLMFLGLMILLVPLNVPGVVFVIPATTLFGAVGGIALSLVGGFVASVIGVVAARRLGRRALVERMPAWLRRREERLSENGFWAVVLLRCCTFLFQPADWLCGLSSMRLRTVLAGTFVGLVPPTIVISLSGGGLLDLLG